MTDFRTKANSSGFLEFGSYSRACKEKNHVVLLAVDGVLCIAFKLAAIFSAFVYHPAGV